MSTIQCKYCGKDVSSDNATCPYCGSSINHYGSQSDVPPPMQGSYKSEKSEPAWETSDGSIIERIINTVKSLIQQPAVFFENLRTEGGFGAPCSYLLFTSLFGIVFYQIYMIIGSILGIASESFTGAFVTAVFACFIGPIIAIISSFIVAGIYHILASVFSVATKPFEATYRGTAYVSGTCALFNVVPVIGSLISFIAHIYYMIVALSKIHGMSMGKACLIVLIPTIVICCCSIVFFFTVGATAFLAALGFAAAEASNL